MNISACLSSLEVDLKTEGLTEARLNKVAKILAMNEIEKCVRKSFGKVSFLRFGYLKDL